MRLKLNARVRLLDVGPFRDDPMVNAGRTMGKRWATTRFLSFLAELMSGFSLLDGYKDQ
jgi:hypothetical protein